MPQVSFFSVREDQLAFLRFLFSETDVRILEHSSLPDSDLREFRSAEEVAEAYPLGLDSDGNGFSVTLALWSPSVMPELEIRRIDFDPKRVRNARFRHEPCGSGLMQLYFGGLRERVITKSHFGNFSQAGARRWDLEQGVDWEALSRLSRKMKNHIRRRMAVQSVPGRPVLSAAAELWNVGYVLKESARSPFHWDSSGLSPDT
jgi:hypothetical protein